jgi:hypothetical protein
MNWEGALRWKNRWTWKPPVLTQVDPEADLTDPPRRRAYQLDYLRCERCQRARTEWQLTRSGPCPFCEGKKFWTTVPKGWREWCRLRFWDFLRNWRIYGKAGTGWNHPWITR